MKRMKKLVLGLDIGISSVGWGVMNEETGEVLEAGVRLFEEATRNGNEERRDFRSSRRVKRREAHRKQRVRELLEEAGFSCDTIGTTNPYLVRRDAIYGKVSKSELAAALYHIVKRRGTFLDVPEEEKTNDNELSTKKQLSENDKLLQNKYICEVQLEKKNTADGKIRNHTNRYRTDDYVKEAKAILSMQKQFYPEITQAFEEAYIQLIKTRRQYYDGPGSAISPTPFGQYFYDKKGDVIRVPMIEKMRGKCTYFPEELRIPKMAYTAELFALLNDLNNTVYADSETGELTHLSEQDKQELIKKYIHDKKGCKNITLKAIMKQLDIHDEQAFKGYRKDLKNDKPLFTEFKGLKALQKQLKGINIPADFYQNEDLLDDISEILSGEKSLTRREEQLTELFKSQLGKSLPEVTAVLINDTSFKEYNALSKKAIQLILPELWSTSKNQMQLFVQHGMDKGRLEKLQSGNKIQFDDEAILSTVAKRSHHETVKIVNKLRKQYGEFHYVVVEMAREKNSDEEKKKYKDMQKRQGDFEKAMAKELGVENLKNMKLSAKQHLALKLLKEQDGRCIYSGKSILSTEIVRDASQFEVDHIIPISLSYDDSQQNKVLCYQSENQKKGQLSPFQYFASGRAKRSFKEFQADISSMRIRGKKKEYLLEQRDIAYNEELQKEFINRNLVDTRYAMKSFANSLRVFYMMNDIETKVLPINGAFTAALRRRAKMNKNRDGHAHHAIDALIVAGIGRLPLIKQFKTIEVKEEGIITNRKTGEVLKTEEAIDTKALNYLRQLMNYENKVKYSHKVDRKINRGVTAKQTIYSTRERDGKKHVIGKIKNIYELDKNGYETLKKRIEKNENDFLMAQHNPETWLHIRKIMEEHAHADNPFQDYYKEHNTFILKDGKVPIKSLRYQDGELGIHIPLTHKYPESRNDVVLRGRTSIRIDIYKNKEGIYKYIGVPYHWFKQVGKKYVLDMDIYNGKEHGKAVDYKKITDDYEFQFSLYKNDMFSYEKVEKRENLKTGIKEVATIKFTRVFRGDNSPRANRIEVQDIDTRATPRQLIAIKPLKNIIKYNTDILGNRYPITKELFVDTLQIH
ncbi:type II CRISPR RNA-guided endonuclease Cas9 [Listeria booriae]|nr:type II CRISPR RNA-guided endonuclease Cas9 [Listeria booriae]